MIAVVAAGAGVNPGYRKIISNVWFKVQLRVQRAADGFDPFVEHVGIYHGGIKIRAH